MLDAGVLTIDGPGLDAMTFTPDEGSRYPSSVTSRSLASGEYTVVAAGGAGVGAFDAIFIAPEAIDISTDFPASAVIPADQPVTVRWAGGTDESVVALEVASTSGDETQRCQCVVEGEAGEVVLGTISGHLPLISGNAEITITQVSVSSGVGAIAETNLSEGGSFRWRRVRRYSNLTLQ